MPNTNRNSALTALVTRCRIALSLLLDEKTKEPWEPVDPASHAPHGFDRIPVYGELVPLEGGWSYAPITHWQLVPTVEVDCTCQQCQGRARGA